MIILYAHVEGPVVIENVCYEAAKLCNRLGIGLDLTIANTNYAFAPPITLTISSAPMNGRNAQRPRGKNSSVCPPA